MDIEKAEKICRILFPNLVIKNRLGRALEKKTVIEVITLFPEGETLERIRSAILDCVECDDLSKSNDAFINDGLDNAF